MDAKMAKMFVESGMVDEMIDLLQTVAPEATKLGNAVCDILDNLGQSRLAETLAKLYKKQVDALVAVGFTREEAIAIALNIKEMYQNSFKTSK